MSAPRRLLIVAPAFPPHPSPATHRSRFVARWASEFGWEPEVVTVAPEFYAEPLDHELAALVPAGVRVSETPAVPLRLTRPLGLSELGMRAYFPMRKVVRAICRDRRPDALFISGPPFQTFGLGADMRAELGIPYVLDYTDPWIDPDRPEYRRPWRKVYWARRIAAASEPRAVRGAAHIFAVSDATHDGVRARHPEIPASRFSALPIGFEEADFAALRARPRANPFWDARDGNVHIVYAGAVSTSMQPAVRAMLDALALLRAERPEAASRIRMHFFGTSYDPDVVEGPVAPLARDAGVSELVDERPRRLAYLDALSVLLAADAIAGVGSTDRHYQASKIFNCILAGRPIVGAYHEASGVCEILRRSSAGALVTYGDAGPGPATVRSLAEALARAAAGELRGPDATASALLAPHTARGMTERMIETIERAVNDRASGRREVAYA